MNRSSKKAFFIKIGVCISLLFVMYGIHMHSADANKQKAEQELRDQQEAMMEFAAGFVAAILLENVASMDALADKELDKGSIKQTSVTSQMLMGKNYKELRTLIKTTVDDLLKLEKARRYSLPQLKTQAETAQFAAQQYMAKTLSLFYTSYQEINKLIDQINTSKDIQNLRMEITRKKIQLFDKLQEKIQPIRTIAYTIEGQLKKDEKSQAVWKESARLLGEFRTALANYQSGILALRREPDKEVQAKLRLIDEAQTALEYADFPAETEQRINTLTNEADRLRLLVLGLLDPSSLTTIRPPDLEEGKKIEELFVLPIHELL